MRLIPLAVALLVTPVLALAEAPPRDRVTLAASATAELPADWLTLNLATTKDGSDAAAVQAQIKQALDAALAEARRVAKPGQVEVQTGGFAVNPRYNSKGGISGWVGRAELIVEGRDSVAIAQLSGRITTLSVAGAAWSLSREAREKAEGDITAQAIARFKARANEVAKAFGYSSYQLGEVNVSGNEGGVMAVPRVFAMKAAAAPMADEALPTEAGKARVTISVNGSIVLTK
ncbi:SIMPL domain-containing protein [Roseateles sp.]|uniref:SIMPL domain-containing protein n=1 Tax=Roseateles sp. TaxID=1971397 RepID=UPI00392B49D2